MHRWRDSSRAARAFLPDFGLAAYCGFGRTPAEQLPQILEDHLKAVAIAGWRSRHWHAIA